MASTWKGSSKKRRRNVVAAPRVVKDVDGRVHLLVQNNGETRFVAGLSAPLFSEPWQDTLTLTAANAVLRHFGEAPSPLQVEALTREAMTALSKLAEGLAAQSERPVACAAGCSHCCHQSVGVTGVEAITIVRYLRATRNTEELAALTARVRDAGEGTRGLNYKERHSPHLPCVFLGAGGECTIYAVRPLVCRAVNSLDAGECRDNLYDDAKRAAYLENGQGASALLAPIRASHAMSAGLQLAAGDVYGLDMRPLDLVAAVNVLLRDVDVEAAWLTGKPALEPAVGSDASTNAELLKVAGLTRS